MGEIPKFDQSGETFIAETATPPEPEVVEKLPYSDEEAIRRAKQADQEMIDRISKPA